MPENKPARSSFISPPPGTPSKATAKLNYVPFSFEEVPPRLPDKDDYGHIRDAEWRKWCDDLDTPQLLALTGNLVDSMVNRGGTTSAYELWFLAEKSLWALQHLAVIEKPRAARFLSGTVRRAVERLNHHAGLKPALYQAAAWEEITWPVLHSPSHFFATDCEEVQEKLSVGSDYFLQVLGRGIKRKKPYDFTVPKNQLVWRVIQTLTANKLFHPPPGEEAGTSAPRWVQECWKLKPLSTETVDK